MRCWGDNSILGPPAFARDVERSEVISGLGSDPGDGPQVLT